MELNGYRKEIINSTGNLLILGGPGSGKTTMALFKALHDIQSNLLKSGQKILFLSFARATVARIGEHARTLLKSDVSENLEISTYHGFTWRLLQSHGYLLNGKRRLKILTPPDAMAQLSHLEYPEKQAEYRRLFFDEGVLSFDVFAALSAQLLISSPKISKLIGNRYPIVMLDEFQDTSLDEWTLIKSIKPDIKTIALADPNQRIYEFRGADPERIKHFIDVFEPRTFDFGIENNRSSGTDIVTFGNELLTGANKGKTYQNVNVIQYPFYRGRSPYFSVKTKLIEGVKKLRNAGKEWSLAILVPTKRQMLEVSDYLSSSLDSLPVIPHDVALEAEAVSLSAVAIAGLLEGVDANLIFRKFLHDLVAHIRGRRGNDGPTQADTKLATALEVYLRTGRITGSVRRKIVENCQEIASARLDVKLTGNPELDWISISKLLDFENATAPIQLLLYDVKFLRLLHKGSQLRENLGGIWRRTSSYKEAVSALRQALQQEYFANPMRKFKGIYVMTIHKSKGKEFEKVIIFEGFRRGKILRQNANSSDRQQALLALRVAVTRAKQRATILTPTGDLCEFLF